MARIRQNLTYSDTRGELVYYKDARRGAVEDSFWDDDELIDHRPSRKLKRPRKRGCPGNENKAHVYVWIEEPHYHYKWTDRGLVKTNEIFAYVNKKTCCGCEKVIKRKWRWV